MQETPPPSSEPLTEHRKSIARLHLADEAETLADMAAAAPVDPSLRDKAHRRASALVRDIRQMDTPGLMEVFLAEYGLSTDEGIALMCLAESLLRVPDADTMDALIEDKIAPSAWGEHLGRSASSLVNASTWALMLTGNVLREPPSGGFASVMHGAVKRLGEPVIRTAVKQAMRELGRQFVLGQSIGDAMERASGMEAKGFTYSYDMLGEAALTMRDADTYYTAYMAAINAIGKAATHGAVKDNPGISIKLSALHPRYEEPQRARVMEELVPRIAELARMAASAGIGLNIDAEEAARLDLSLDVMEQVIADPELAGWDGFGVVVQAYGKRAMAVIDWLHALAKQHERRIMVRLVKGAYWDSEIKWAQAAGLAGFPVFTRKPATDVAWLHCARHLLNRTDRIYPQFATHNAHSVASVLEMGADTSIYEFQRLHGMGESLHTRVLQTEGTRCRIYAPVGAHKDLLAYLVRRLLENGANSSFVNQIVDKAVAPETVAADPFDALENAPARQVRRPAELFAPERANSKGFDLYDPADIARIKAARVPWRAHRWNGAPLLAKDRSDPDRRPVAIVNPANGGDEVGMVREASIADIEAALAGAAPWTAPVAERAAILNTAADLYEKNFGELFAILTREAGKITEDALAELREAVDFLRYYAAEATKTPDAEPVGTFACISPWNFPLAIFTGQISAALAAGNAVIAKPAEATPLIAHRAVELMHKAGVPRNALQLLPGTGSTVGAAITSDARIGGVCFTGSTATAQTIHRAMADNLNPSAPLIAETGGINAMIVDSTALPEQAVRDIIVSSFRSAGQRCSALRVLYLQEDIAEPFLAMLFGAMDELAVADPWALSTDIGPVIDAKARDDISAYLNAAEKAGKLLKRMAIPEAGTFVSPAVIRVSGIEDVQREVFGPVLHVATFGANEIDTVVSAINATGYGLTFGMHTRIDDRVEQIASAIHAGNIYVNRNQIGAIVGSQPFGGEGLSGTGPKAGGPHYLPRFQMQPSVKNDPVTGRPAEHPTVQQRLDRVRGEITDRGRETRDLPGPTGESNRWSTHPRGLVLCLGPSLDDAREQARQAMATGCATLMVAPGATGANSVDGVLDPHDLTELDGFDAVAFWGEEATARAIRRALVGRDGPIVPLATARDITPWCLIERHVCIDTTAAGGNATLLAEMS
ncbi:MAG: bifunctional proline dehydrogenase/L-glutamate gamma-semialdehyde dehydrogenase PutA [Roseitalea sp.]|jgi:RHH-type proline utilization regulon transcriptional repressor/proline dehydrogenase/delta 1-pyrroline-5-carboxylate dehydrogenase|nr:bifunctional proline dehydrogenase/L-glutamate gamma-semialdehyde dehydrogenase PutA [Roseitalea sp.]MBO6723428.1 bifunctional proline dehydrogenase/L-glutamate gamma-semialdehyde dehydrogenase PutA [Roseitalea sp.]MBO6742115.1 bifunctional proline dehydrogenase/L-glutamate gamma-semialdehyde dehydrogenase PutA [Roseitalea sp.]